MGVKSKCNLLFVFIFCAFLITVGSICNVFTIAAFPSCLSQRLQDTIFEIVEEIVETVEEIKETVEEIGETVEEIGEKVPKGEMPALVWIILIDLLIILLAMVPKMTFDECKTFFEEKKRWDDVAFLASVTVSFKRFFQMFNNCAKHLTFIEPNIMFL